MATESHTQTANSVRSVCYVPPEPSIALNKSFAEYFEFEVRPKVPDAWIDESKNKADCDIPSNRHCNAYEPPSPRELIQANAKTFKQEIIGLLVHVTISNGVVT